MLIAYDGSEESSKALRAAIVLAPALGVEVTISMVAALGGEDALLRYWRKPKRGRWRARQSQRGSPAW